MSSAVDSESMNLPDQTHELDDGGGVRLMCLNSASVSFPFGRTPVTLGRMCVGQHWPGSLPGRRVWTESTPPGRMMTMGLTSWTIAGEGRFQWRGRTHSDELT